MAKSGLNKTFQKPGQIGRNDVASYKVNVRPGI